MMDAFELPVTLVQALAQRAALTPDRVALRFLAEDPCDEAVLSYRELDQRARTIAAALQARTEVGDRAILLFPSGPDTSRRSSAASTPASSRCRLIRQNHRGVIIRSVCCRSSAMPNRACY